MVGLWLKPSQYFCRDLLFHIDLLLAKCLSLSIKPFLHLGLIEGDFLDLVLDESGHQDNKSLGVDHPCHNCVNTDGLGYTFLYGLPDCLIKGSAPRSFGLGSADNYLDDGYHFCVQASLRGLAYLTKEEYEGVLYEDRKTKTPFGHSFFHLR